VNRPPWLAELERGLAQGSSIPVQHGDFGGVPARTPGAWVQTESDIELQHVLAVARLHRIPVALRGSGHSSGGQTFAPGGIVLHHHPRHARLELRDERVSIPGHWTWGRVEQAVQRLGRDLPVTTSCVETTVAGTLSVGGIGPRSARNGPQVDHVTELCLITAGGERIQCSERQSPDVFHSALTGMGQVGVLERVTLRTVPRRPYLCASSSQHASFAEVALCVRPFAEPTSPVPDDFRVLVKRGKLECFRATRHATREEAEQAARRRDDSWASGAERGVLEACAFERDERAMPLDAWQGCRHLWSDYCFEPDAFVRFASWVDAQLAGSLTMHLAYVLCLAPRSGEPLALDLRPRSSRRSFSVGLFFSVAREDREAIERARSAHASALSECLALGGKPYLHGLWGGREGLLASELDRIFGAGYRRARAVRERLDPSGILNPHALN
jgi:FAD/FMN-containing dehydrogenase